MTKSVSGRGCRGPAMWKVIAAAGAIVLAAAACVPGQNGSQDGKSGEVKQADGPAKLVVWTDPPRAKGFEMYRKAHPEVDLQIETLPADVDQRLLLANQAGRGWPDVILLDRRQFKAYAEAPYNFSADIGPSTKDIVDKVTPVLQSRCTDGEKVYCLSNDFSPMYLWYDKDLIKEFGYKLPTTWEEYEQLGLQVAKEHPGYIVGDVNFQNLLAPARCPVHQDLGNQKLQINLSDEKCTRVFKMVDSLVAAGAIPRIPRTDPQFTADYGTKRKIIMMHGPVHLGLNIFVNRFKIPDGALGIAPPLRWSSEDRVYNALGGGVGYAVSRHSEYRQAATDLVKWMVSGPYQTEGRPVTFPAYRPAQEAWLQHNEKVFYTGDVSLAQVVDAGINSLSPYWTDVNLADIRAESSFSTAVRASFAKGTPVMQLVPRWQDYLDNEAKAAGWDVTK